MRRKQSCRFVPLEECDPIASESYKSESRVWKENPEASCARKERLQMLADTITQLPRDLRDVCVLRNVIGLSTREVATRLEISTIAVRLRLFRAHVRLRSNVGVVFNHGGAKSSNRRPTQQNQKRVVSAEPRPSSFAVSGRSRMRLWRLRILWQVSDLGTTNPNIEAREAAESIWEPPLNFARTAI